MEHGMRQPSATKNGLSFRLRAAQLAPLLVFLVVWEYWARLEPRHSFLFGAPSQVISYLVKGIADGTLLIDTAVTAFEAIAGFLLGNVIGASVGLALWSSRTVFNLAKPYIITLGSAPVFALAPVLIIWFGTGILSKVVIATLSTLFVALFQAYRGAMEVNEEQIQMLKSFGATQAQVFQKIVVPSSMVWVVSAFKLNIGFALLGAFIGEYISSERGLGHLILVAGGLYNVSLLLTGVFLMVIIALVLDAVVGKLEVPLRRWLARAL